MRQESPDLSGERQELIQPGERVIVLEDEPLSEVMQKNNCCWVRSINATWQGMISVLRSHLIPLDPQMG